MGETVTIIGGCGHVGLPFGVVLAEMGHHTVNLLDVDPEAINLVNRGKCPFVEEDDIHELLNHHVQTKGIKATSNPKCIEDSSLVVIIIGTPTDGYGDPDFDYFFNIIDKYIPYFNDKQTIMLRSTVYPGTTDLLREKLLKARKDCRVVYCPERIVQGKGFSETLTLPQMIGAKDWFDFTIAKDYFAYLPDHKVIHMKPVEAELAKLFTNAYRYIQFAVTNQFSTIAEDAGVDYNVIHKGMTSGYERLRGFPINGLAGGPCLIKDTFQLSSFSAKRFTLGETAFNVNEGYAVRAVSKVNEYFGGDFLDKKIVLLGMTFKPDNDDVRDSLSYKIKKYLKPFCNTVHVYDPYLTIEDDEDWVDASTIFTYDMAIVCTPHKEFSKIEEEWGKFGKGAIINLWGDFYAK